jgi:NNP family nitrate/nitrite transporter-like MFS transporter
MFPVSSGRRQGTALGIFSAGNVGAAVTNFLAPRCFSSAGGRLSLQVWAGALAVMAVVFWFCTNDDPAFRLRQTGRTDQKSFWLELAPLKNLQVWRFGLYYFFVFGGFVALALWLPRYLTGVYGFGVATAGMIGATYSIPATVFRAFGGILSDRIGARTVMYATFTISAVATLILSLPVTDCVVHGMEGPISFHFEIGPIAALSRHRRAWLLHAGLGSATAVYKHYPSTIPTASARSAASSA